MFKSEVNEVYDYRNVKISENLLKIKINESEIKDLLMTVAKKNAVNTEVNDAVKDGDQITLEMKSNLEKFNKKNVPIIVGMGLLNRGFEDKLVGMKKDKVNSVSVDENSVTVKIMSIKRKTVPNVTDEMIKKLNIKSVSTVDEFKRYSYNEKVSKIKEKKFEDIYKIILNEVTEKSKFTLVHEDLEELIESELNRCREIAKSEGLVFDKMTKKQLLENVSCGSIKEFKEFLKKNYELTLKWVLVAIESAKKEGIEFNEATYEEYIKQEAVKSKTDIEIVKKLNPLLGYITFSYSIYLKKEVGKYFETKFNCE